MNVLVDTPIWSLAFRRRPTQLSKPENILMEAWSRLIQDNQAVLIGPVRQEILSGIRDIKTYDRLRRVLRAFDDEPLILDDYENAAKCGNVCRSRGITGSSVDYLICAVAIRRNLAIYTTDADFTHYAKHLPIHLYEPA
ncbi:MAG: PIN domain-containing protein [Phycisphaerales bacterium]|nr:PIN domain-containing protein [Phycisphaerales bacterium]